MSVYSHPSTPLHVTPERVASTSQPCQVSILETEHPIIDASASQRSTVEDVNGPSKLAARVITSWLMVVSGNMRHPASGPHVVDIALVIAYLQANIVPEGKFDLTTDKSSTVSIK